MFCWADKWAGLSMEDIRKKEDETKSEMDSVSQQPPIPISQQPQYQ